MTLPEPDRDCTLSGHRAPGLRFAPGRACAQGAHFPPGGGCTLSGHRTPGLRFAPAAAAL